MGLAFALFLGGLDARASAPASPPEAWKVAPSEEYRFKAAYIYNFLGYTTWPKGTFENDESPIELLIVGTDPFEKVIDETFDGKRIGKRPVQISRAKELPKKPDCHVVFCAGLDSKQRAALLKALAGKPVLVIGEDEGFAEAGATINFYFEKTKLRFEINTDVIKASHLTISSQLLKLAKIVKSKGDDEESGEKKADAGARGAEDRP